MNELLPFSDSFINNETQSNEILNIIKVASSIFFTSVFRDNTGFYPKYLITNFGICLRKFTKIHLAVEMIHGARKQAAQCSYFSYFFLFFPSFLYFPIF